jgi:hypothetical protein
VYNGWADPNLISGRVVLIGLANFVFAALIFIILFALRRPVVDGQAKSAGKRRAKAPGLRQEPTLNHREKNHEG